MNSNKSKDRKSLCEESMLVFVNILKLSSVSFTKRNLATKSDHHDHDHDHVTDHQYSDEAPPLVPVPPTQRRKMSQKPPHKSKRSYVMLPEHDETTRTIVDGEFSDYIKSFHEKTASDLENAKATNFIKKFHEKNLKDLNNESMRRPNYVLPPPPHHQLFQ